MGEDITTEDAPTPELGDAGKKALEAERDARKAEARKAKEQQARADALEARLKEIEDKDKSEAERHAAAATAADERATRAESELLRLKIAIDKGLTPTQAKRLVGTTEEELAADADEFLESIGKGTGDPTEPTAIATPPKPKLQGGASSEDEPNEIDVAAIVGGVPRGA